VLAFVGDAGLLMSAPELGTLAGLASTVVVVVFADRALSLIELKLGQRSIPAGALATPEVDWNALAWSFGIPSATVGDEHALADALAGALQRSGPSMVVATVDPSSYGRMAQVFRG
jgi:thiamine pyrophosphate-dependent acetolactate synthase large subunit-like protein